MIVWLILFIVILVVCGVVFYFFAPQFGKIPMGNDLEIIKKSDNYTSEGESFYNREKTTKAIEILVPATKNTSTLDWFLTTGKQIPVNSAKDIPIIKHSKESLANYQGKTRVIWLGHSSFLIQFNVYNKIKNILIDPMFSKYPSPTPYIIAPRFNPELPIKIADLPEIETVIISHDHYDHLDYSTIKKLKDKAKNFVVPLGVGSHLRYWNIADDKITELNWWQQVEIGDFRLIATPARHFSGRRFSTRNKTLWVSWIIQNRATGSENIENLYFSGDSGYAQHFKQIGDKYGPFDIAMIENGQYNKKDKGWSQIHMLPAETVQAGIDLKAKSIIPIHWGAFKLAFHDWNEPVIYSSKAAKAKGIKMSIPKIGQPVILYEDFINDNWWQ